MTKQWDASTVMPAMAAYGVNAPGYNGTDRFRFNCSQLNLAGQLVCYSYATGLGYAGSSGNTGETMVQYGWYVQILNQSDDRATVRIWNVKMDPAITVDPETAPVGSTVTVDVRNHNAGDLQTGLLQVVPIDTAQLAYVDGSVYGGAFPIGVPMERAREIFLAGGVEALKNTVTPESGIVAVAWIGDQAAGQEVNFGFQAEVLVGAADGAWPLYDLVMKIETQQEVASAMTTLTVPALNTFEVTLQEGAAGYDGTSDTYVSAWANTTNYGTDTALWARQPAVKSPLVKFDLTGITGVTQLVEAKIGVYVTWSASNPVTLASYQLLKPWSEGEATWMQAAAGASWEMPGAMGPSDRAATATDTLTASGGGTWAWFDVTELVQGWLDDPGTNHGVLILGSGNVNSELQAISSDFPLTWMRPQFRLQYQAP
jgi:hypothetical protein